MATKKTTTATTATTTRKKITPSKSLNSEKIRMRAEEIYKARVNNGGHGDELSDWLQAEKEVSGSN